MGSYFTLSVAAAAAMEVVARDLNSNQQHSPQQTREVPVISYYEQDVDKN